MLEAEPPPKPKPLRVSFPRISAAQMMPDKPNKIKMTLGWLEIEAPSAIAMLENLMTLGLIMQNDLDRFQAAI